jgi:YidC/Oxa1 family membrane protein insertase
MIIFFSLFYVLRAIAEWKPGQVPKYGMTVSLMVSARRATIFGVHLSDKLLLPHTPGMGVTASIVAAVTVAISATTTFLTVRQTSKRGLMQTNIDPDNPMAQSQKYMMYIVPFFSLTGLYWQYGLVLYWVTTNLWTLGQQYFMFRNWTVEDTQPAGATASAGSPVRATQSSLRPSSSGSAKTAAGAAKPRAAARPGAAAKPAAGAATKTAASAPKPAAGSTRPAAGNGRSATGNGRPATAATRPKAASSASSGSSGSSSAQARPATPQTGSARGDAAAASATPNDGVRRSRLRLGRQKQEPVPEPEVPVAKVVRQQPVRQAKSKRSGKR